LPVKCGVQKIGRPVKTGGTLGKGGSHRGGQQTREQRELPQAKKFGWKHRKED
jgi:hypothetical protein